MHACPRPWSAVGEGLAPARADQRGGLDARHNVEEFRARYRRRVDLHAGVVFLAASAGIEAQKGALYAARDDIDRDGNLMNTEVLVEPHGAYRVRRFDLP